MSKTEKVLVAMSGGVDSSVAAALLKERGYDVSGVTMLLDTETNPAAQTAVADAKIVCAALEIEHHAVDLSAIFRRQVIDQFVAAYAAGRTPNPCINCNRYLKSAALLEKAAALGAKYVATGHYARIAERDGRRVLLKGLDAAKDQSYVLFRLTPAMLDRFLLPLGDMTKHQVRAMAAELNLPVAQKKESQEICFIPDNDYHAFLRERCPASLRPGDIVYTDGTVLGRHQGVPLYTIGQRKGLGIAHPTPLFVTALDSENNRVIVGEAADVYSPGLIVEDISWTADGVTLPLHCTVKIRYGKNLAPATVAANEPDATRVDDTEIAPAGKNATLTVKFTAPQRAVTPGQAAVFYDGDIVLGGGTIRAALAE